MSSAATKPRRTLALVDRQGKPLADALLTLRRGPGPVPEMAVATDGNGSTVLALQPGRYVAEVAKAGGGKVAVEFDWSSGASSIVVHVD